MAFLTLPSMVSTQLSAWRRWAMPGPLMTVGACTQPAPVGIVELHPTGEWPGAVAFQHRLHELVLHQPGAVLRDAQLAGQLQGGEAALGLGDQVHGEEPDVERQLGIGEQRAILRPRDSRQRDQPSSTSLVAWIRR